MKIKIATLNFWGLPWPFSVDKKQRLKKLINIIKNENIDIIALQEIWLYKDINYLFSKLPNYYFFNHKGFLFNSSGLLFLSKFPFFKKEFFPFTNKEFIAKKGILKAKIKIFNKQIKLLNTHLVYSSIQSTSVKERQIKNLMSKLDDQPTILLGDFNTNLTNLNLPDNFKLISQSNTKTLNPKNFYVTKRFNKFHESGWLCDLIFCNFHINIIEKKTIKKPLLSDHYIVISEIEIPSKLI